MDFAVQLRVTAGQARYARPVFDPIGWFLAAEAAVQISAIALCLSLITTGLAIGGFSTAVRSLNATRRQEKRRQPQLIFTYLASSRGDSIAGTEYLFRLRARNPTDSNNALAAAELEIRYLLGGQLVSLRMPSSSGNDSLIIPALITAGSSIEGTVKFRVAKELLDGRKPHEYVLHLTDTYETKALIPVEIVYENRTAE